MMKKRIAAAALAALALFAGAACAEKVVTVGVFRDGAIARLDAASYNGPHFLFKMIYDGLVEDGGKGHILPQLAERWEISPDGKTYTFHLRKGVTFSDGTPFDADAVVFNMKRWTNQKINSSMKANELEKAEALDPHTVRFTFKDNAYQILTELTYPRPNRFISPKAVKLNAETGKEEITAPIGTGMWMVQSYKKDQEYTLVPNPHYWGEKPKLDKIVFKVIPDAQARVMALKTGEIDILGGDYVGKLPVESYVELRGQNGDIKTWQKATECSHFLAMNQANPALADKAVRQALNYAVDQAAIAKYLYDGVGFAATGAFQQNVPYTTPENNYTLPADTAKARQLLDAAGYSLKDGVRERDGKKLAFRLVFTTGEFPEWKALSEYVQAQFAEIGVSVELKPVDRSAYYDALARTRDFDLALMRTSTASWMPHGAMILLFGEHVGQQEGEAWYDPGLLADIRSAYTAVDEAERAKAYDRAYRFISAESLVVPVYFPVTTFAVNTAKVKDFEPGVNSYAPVEWQKLDVK